MSENTDYETLKAERDAALNTCSLIAEALGITGAVAGDTIARVQQLVAENSVMKSGATYFSCGSEYGFDLFRDKQAAIDVCLQEIELHREGYLDGDGWDDGVGRTAWGIIIQSAQGRDAQGIHESEAGHTYQTCDYQLEDEIKTTTTTQELNEIKAQGVDELVALLDRMPLNDMSQFDVTSSVVEFAARLRGGE